MAEALSNELFEELGSSCRGQVYRRGDPGFGDYSTIFNGNVVSHSKAVVCPLDAEDVSKIILFCSKHSLSPSVKAGGYGTAGWAIGGDIIIDVSKLVEVDIEIPKADGSFTSLRDVAAANSKGKQVQQSSTEGSGKRRREEDANLRMYDNASQAVASFLRGPPVLGSATDGPSPSVRRRLEAPGSSSSSLLSAETLSRQISGSSGSSNSELSEGISNSSREQSTSTLGTTPSPPPFTQSSAIDTAPTAHRGFSSPANPFGYLDTPSNLPSAPPPTMLQTPYTQAPPPLTSWTPGPNTNFPSIPGLFEQIQIPAQVEPIYKHAYVTFGAGMRQKEIDIFTAQNKLEANYITGSGDGIPYHVPFAAHPVGSSIMLLGGFGFLSRLHGLSIDNLVEVEMVLADGRIIVVSENEYPDLWWAVRGAGPCFGVATRYKAKAYPVPVVFAGNLLYRFNKATAPSLIKHFRDCVKGAPRELYANILLTAGPAGKDSLMVVQMCYIGSREKGQEYLAAISSWDGEKCLLNEVDEKSFLHQQDSVAQVLRGKGAKYSGRQWFIRSALISSLPDGIVNETVMQFADTPVGCTWLFELAGGAIIDFEDTSVPKSQREASFTIAALHQWEMDVHDDECVDSAEEWIAGTLKPVHIGGPFPSFLGRHELPERTKACFGENWQRLSEIKKFYDPNNLFRNTFWPLDAAGEDVEAHTHEPPTPPFLSTSIRGQKRKIFI
ncbi:hypothetical protein NLJ89_g5289 [Agrocybe chaxingu]|uniref:FAD-binding PCMH-type domain-containing protein n=1 Tax=Agrocybe chaxingu TaxID=84603 RepID=A0A9W8MXC6_9AGAR|nr:hypothetical protein NLJ89_g5289 [Agrocybe chaxingu]